MKTQSVRTTSSIRSLYHRYTSSLSSSSLLSLQKLLLNGPNRAFSNAFPVFSPAQIRMKIGYRPTWKTLVIKLNKAGVNWTKPIFKQHKSSKSAQNVRISFGVFSLISG
jgi:hypothetical protein